MPRLQSPAAKLCLFPILLLALAGCDTLASSGLLANLAKPTVASVRPKITGIDLNGVNLAFDVGVNNPYGVALPIPKFDYQLEIAGTPLASQTQAAGATLPAGGTGTVSLPVRMNYQEILKVAEGLRDAKEVPYTLKGDLIAEPMGKELRLPLQTSGSVPVLRPPKLSDIKVTEAQNGGVLGASKIGIDVNVENPNVFALGLQQLGYKATLGDLNLGELGIASPTQLGAGQTGKVHLSAAVSGLQALGGLLGGGGKIGTPHLAPTGAIQTPYGAVKLP